MLLALASQLQNIEDEDIMSTCSHTAQEKGKTTLLIEIDEEDTECINLNNGDMETHMGQWLNNLYKSNTPKDDKGRGHA